MARKAKAAAPKNAPRKKTTSRKTKAANYLHGFSAEEQERLRIQARVTEPLIHDRLPFRRRTRLLEVGSGVGAQTEILLRHFPDLRITCAENNEAQIAEARRFLRTVPWAKGRYDLKCEDAMALSFGRDRFDSAFLCWVLEHVPDPARALAEVRRVLAPGSPLVVTEVMNHSFFLDPYSPNTWKYWMAFNDHQLSMGGDPFVGAKLGNLLQANGYRDIRTTVKVVHLDNREPAERADFLGFWTDLLLSGAPLLLDAGRVSQKVVDEMRRELHRVTHDPNSVFYYSFLQAHALA